MSGIINYIHGEEGVVDSLTIHEDDSGKFRLLKLSENPFRSDAVDSGDDIRFDPTLTSGDRACYVRLDPFCGFWLRSAERYEPELERVVDRWAPPSENEEPTSKDFRRAKAPAPIDASIFLSHSSWNKLFARFLERDLRRYARVTTWLDENQRESLGSKRLRDWLKDGVESARGIVVLWTAACETSKWVRREYEWAIERRTAVPIVVVNCDGSTIPSVLAECAHVVVVDGLWYAHGLGEEIFSYLHGLEPRSCWLAENARRGHPVREDLRSHCMTFADIAPHEGTAASDLQWSIEGGELRWWFELRERATGGLRLISGPRTLEEEDRKIRISVDFGLATGDRVAQLASYRTSSIGWSSGYYSRVWMRIDGPPRDIEWVDSCHYWQVGTAREIESYRPEPLLTSGGDPGWCGQVSAQYEHLCPQDISEAIEILLANRIQWRPVEGITRIEDYDWLQIEKYAEQLHDAGVAEMLKHGYRWCPRGHERENRSHYMAPWTRLEASYREPLIGRVRLAIRAIVESGFVLIPPSDLDPTSADVDSANPDPA